MICLGVESVKFRATRAGAGAAKGRVAPERFRKSPKERVTNRPLADNTPVTVDDTGTMDTALVTIPASVIDRDGKFVPFLKKRDFRIYEDGVEQDIESLTSVETPFHVALVLDTSNSTLFRLDDIQDAAFAFIKQLRSDDQVMVVSFDSKVRFHCDFTNDYDVLRQAIDETRTGGSTKLYEAVDKVVDRLAQIEGRKAIVLFTDGVDTASRRANYQNTIDKVEESGALVYPIKYDTENDQQSSPSPSASPWPWPTPHPPNKRRWPFDNLAAPVFQQWPSRSPSGGAQTGSGDYRRRALLAGTGRPQRRATLRSRHALQPLAGFFGHSRRVAPSIRAQLLPDQREEGRRVPAGQSPRRKTGDDRPRARRLPRVHGCAGDGKSKIEDRRPRIEDRVITSEAIRSSIFDRLCALT